MIYKGNQLKEIIFPLGGIGTGSVGLAGNGSLVDWEIFNRPNKGSRNGYSCFAVKARFPDGKTVTKILQGDQRKDLVGQYERSTRHGGYGYGPATNTFAGFPHFRHVKFDGRFPVATLTFRDEDFPAVVELMAFNPFIPLDADNSSLPAAFFRVRIKSLCDGVKYTVMLSVTNPFAPSENRKLSSDRYTAIHMISRGKTASDRDCGDLTVAVDQAGGLYQEYWYRGIWQDSITTFWNDLSGERLQNRTYETAGQNDSCSIGACGVISKGQSRDFRFLLAWNVPNNYNYWDPCLDENGADITWRNYYATRFSDSAETAFYGLDHWDRLYRKTDRFRRSLHGATLDKAVIDAVSATLSVLKSPAVLRLEDGTFYGWEGATEKAGSCEGTCTHVWSYAYALCFLFPELERSLRDTEFRYDTDEDGRMYFRTALPLGRGHVVQPPCVDGQMATVIKIYRDWKLTGNSQWLRDNWGNIRKILDYAWNERNGFEWDRDRDGVLEGRQHHTLDMELFGPSAWLQGMYLAALKAAAEMAGFLGDGEKQAEYAALFEKGRRWTKENLFNGSYFCHKVDLTDRSPTVRFACDEYWNEEAGQLKYQIGDGCEIDQLLGQWHANICGLGDIFDRNQRQTALKSMMANNFKESMRSFPNMWRVFALNDEGGAVMCDYPEGSTKPAIPIPYCEECMTGFEYAFAGLLVSEGLTEEGLRVVRAIRDRYDGEKRNPWNEIECGSNYARPMASFALLPIFSGFSFDVPSGAMGFAPRIAGDFRCMWNLGCAWGDYARKGSGHTVTVADGALRLRTLSIAGLGPVKAVLADGKPTDFRRNGDTLTFPSLTVRKSLRIET